jgi:polyphosphate kinase
VAAGRRRILPQDRFLDREISWLQFNERVLQLAMDEHRAAARARASSWRSSPATSTSSSWCGSPGSSAASPPASPSARPLGLEPREVLDRISDVSHELMRRTRWVFWDQVRPALDEEGITHRARGATSARPSRRRFGDYFREQIFPVLTPLAVDPAHPFPYISGLSLNLAVVLVNPKTGKEHFARVKVPPVLPRFLGWSTSPTRTPSRVTRFVPLEDLIAAHLDQLFTGMEVREHFTFRVTRNEDLEVEEDDAENLLTALEKELTRRRFGPPVRLEVDDAMDDRVLDLLTRELGVTEAETYRLPAPLDLRGLFLSPTSTAPTCNDPPFVPMTHPDLAPTERSKEGDLFAAIRKQGHPAAPPV